MAWYGAIRSVQKATFMPKICFCMYYAIVICNACVLCMQYYALLLYEMFIKRMHIIKIIPFEVPLLNRG